MSVKKVIVAIVLLSVAATAQVGFAHAMPESASVTLVFIALAVIAFTLRPARPAPLVTVEP